MSLSGRLVLLYALLWCKNVFVRNCKGTIFVKDQFVSCLPLMAPCSSPDATAIWSISTPNQNHSKQPQLHFLIYFN